MSRAIDVAVKLIEFNNAIDEMLLAKTPERLINSHQRAIEIASQLPAVAGDNDACFDMIAHTMIRGAMRIEAATDALGKPDG